VDGDVAELLISGGEYRYVVGVYDGRDVEIVI